MEVNPNLSEKALVDLDIVARARQGDESAFHELHEKYKNSIYFLILRMVGNMSDAEDLTMEAFGKAFRNIHQYVPRYAFSSWLYKIATNNCIDFIRKKKMNIIDYDVSPRLQSEAHAQSPQLVSHQLDPEEKLIRQQSLERIKVLIEQLKPQYRRLVYLRYFAEYTYDEISIELDLPMGTVKAQLFRAREMLHDLLKDSSSYK